MFFVIRCKFTDVAGSTFLVTDAIYFNRNIFESCFLENEGHRANDERVGDTFLCTKNFQAKLTKLTQASTLRIFVAKKWTIVVEHDRLRKGVHAVLEVRAHYRSGSLGTHSEMVAT